MIDIFGTALGGAAVGGVVGFGVAKAFGLPFDFDYGLPEGGMVTLLCAIVGGFLAAVSV